MSQAHKHSIWSTGFAMFSMFFGAGNVVFPLLVGQQTQSTVGFAMVGLLLTAVAIPFIGLMAMTLYQGDYHPFFARLGKKTGFLLACFLMAIIGPFGAAPRTITLSHATIQMYLPSLSLPLFSALSCLLIFFLTYKPRRILDILGFVLTPVLLGSLAIIVVKGLWTAPEATTSTLSSWKSLWLGLTEGYNTMDLPGAFFFSAVVIGCLQAENTGSDARRLIPVTLKASAVGATLLAATYLGFSYVAAYHSQSLAGVPNEALLGALAQHIMGPAAGIIACLAVSLACLTTAIALTNVFAEFLRRDIFQEKASYLVSLAVTLVTMFLISTLEFSGISRVLTPILQVAYPGLILLALANLGHQLLGIRTVRAPVALAFVGSLLLFFLG